ncbi:glycosyl transferase family 1 [Macrococcus hajekii]|uniref:glycosyltransferase family 4 protein n=1 Tax=Macrococcus hajekii TaxID=198482 RepID=UPI0019988F6D|nr:glycosyltransferase family 4 protein [Macrococcus hajekii]GGA98251.1 glycosyl transferase family 1 [Macrococcus hajekii]
MQKKIIQLSAIDMTMNNFLRPLNLATKEEGWDVHCVCQEGLFTEYIKNDKFEFHNVSIDRKISPISNIKSILSLIKLFRKEKPDIVHVHTPVASVLGRIAAKLAGVPNIIYTAHGFYFHEGMTAKQYRFFYNIEKYVGRLCTDYIFTQSQEDYEVAKTNRFLTSNKNNNYVWISNGIDLDNKYNIKLKTEVKNYGLRKQLSIPNDHLVVSFIGRLVKEKGIIDLLEAYDLLKYKNVSFIVMGMLPQGERDNETYNSLENYKLNNNIKFVGHVNNAEDYLFLSDIFCLPSYREGMPRSIIEAMAMKNAVLATNIRGSREEVIDGETGYLFETGSSGRIAHFIDYLNNDRKKLELFKQNGLKRAHELYDENKVVRKQIEVFNNIKG